MGKFREDILMPIIIDDIEQGSDSWIQARLGIPTASQASRIVTPGGKPSSSQRKYIAELCAEWALGEPASEFMGTEWTERGKTLEDEARRFFAFERDCEYQQVGLVYRDERRDVAASPDGLVDGRGPLELKCAMPKTHLLWLSDDGLPREHVMQVQMQLWVCGADIGDWFSYCPGLPPLILEVRADPKIQDALSEHVPAFISELTARKQRLVELGVEPWQPAPPPKRTERRSTLLAELDAELAEMEARASDDAAPSTTLDVDAWLDEYDKAQEATGD